MSNYELLRLIVWVIGVPIIVYLCVNAVRKVRAIRALDTELKAEAEQNAKNPYAEMAQIMEARQLMEKAKRSK